MSHPYDERVRDEGVVQKEIKPRYIFGLVTPYYPRKASPFPSSSHPLNHGSSWYLRYPIDSLYKKALGCKWVYKIKRKSDRTVERFKARLVILGNHQVAGIDYTETFAKVAKMVTVRVLLAVAAAKKWELHQIDVHNGFLRGDLNEEAGMKFATWLECKPSWTSISA
ncbi:retrovirus-related pol polyprotein from transposon TNT 1-94 [Tanacetum coccineum]